MGWMQAEVMLNFSLALCSNHSDLMSTYGQLYTFSSDDLYPFNVLVGKGRQTPQTGVHHTCQSDMVMEAITCCLVVFVDCPYSFNSVAAIQERTDCTDHGW